MDIQIQIQNNMEQLREKHYTQITTNHVKGHQDNKKKKLTWVEEFNVEVDGLADEAKFKAKPKETHYPSQVVSMWMDGHQITAGIDK